MSAARRLLAHPFGWIASGFGAGFAPFAPGTVGSVVALLPWVLVREWPLALSMAMIVASFAIGVLVSGWVIGRLGAEDPGVVVIDEFVGQWLALWLVAAMHALWPQWPRLPMGAELGFALLCFRLCDIGKPWPASWADRELSGGIGAMLDDAFAGIWAGLLACAAIACWATLA